jgi:hypothetical protein
MSTEEPQELSTENSYLSGTTFINSRERVLGSIELAIMCFLLPSALILTRWTVKNRLEIGLNKHHSALFIIGGLSFGLSKLFYIPWEVSFHFPPDSIIQSESGFLATNILGLLADICNTIAFLSYSIAITPIGKFFSSE